MKQFVLFTGTFSPYGRNRTKMAGVWKDVFKLEENGYLDAEKIKSLDLHQMKIFCRAVEAPHGVVTNGSEPVFVRPGERHKWEMATDYEEDTSDRYEEDEDEIRLLTHYDNMLQHLSEEERQAYIQKRREEKEKFGVQYDGDHMDMSRLSEPARILMQLSWRIDDIPEVHHPHILRGRIPEDFREEFLSALPESLLEKYEKYFERDRIPKVMVKALIAGKRGDYSRRMRQELENEEENEDRADEKKKDEL